MQKFKKNLATVNFVNFLPSRPSSISSRVKMGIDESVLEGAFFLCDDDTFPKLVVFFLVLRGPQQKSKQKFAIAAFLVFTSLAGGSYPYSACLLNTQPVPTYTGPWSPSKPFKLICKNQGLASVFNYHNTMN